MCVYVSRLYLCCQLNMKIYEKITEKISVILKPKLMKLVVVGYIDYGKVHDRQSIEGSRIV